MGGFPNVERTFEGVPRIRIIMLRASLLGSPIQGNYQMHD